MFSACSYVYADKFTACVQNAGLPTRAVLRWGRGAQAPQNVGQPPNILVPTTKIRILKIWAIFYSGEINTRISSCLSNDEITDNRGG